MFIMEITLNSNVMITLWQGRDEDDEIRMVMGMVRKDVLRTDRLHPFYAGEDNANGTALFNLLVTFAVTHPRLSYWQGMSDIASPILAVEGDEATTYVCFCALMRRLATSFSGDGAVMTARFKHLVSLLRHFDRPLYSHICRCGADDMFFTYRWLLLEMKREFPLDDAMYALEVMWSSLPPVAPPDGDLPLFDAAYRDATIPSSAPASHAEAYVHLRRRVSCGHTHAVVCGGDSKEVHRPSVNGNPSDGIPEEVPVPNSGTADSSPEDSVSGDAQLVKQGRSERRSGNSAAVRLSEDASDSDVDEVGEQTGLLTSIEFAKVSPRDDASEDRPPPLPTPPELGCGNPFLMFLCLSALILQRDRVISSCNDYNDIAMHYDKMVRRHRVEDVVHYARQLYATYLKELQQQQQQRKTHSDDDHDDDDDDHNSSSVTNRI